VLRDNSTALLTILEVLIHDPMYQWTLSPTKALERQRAKDKTQDDTNANNLQQQQQSSQDNNDSSGNRADAAERALLRIKQVPIG
jgi:serine-protein kinase ATM